MVKGVAGYVLPRFDNTVYIRIEDGDHFGHVDFALDSEVQDIAGEISLPNPKRLEKNLLRRFTVQALINCELLILMIEDLGQMVNEFPEIYNELFANSIKRLMKELKIKKDAIDQCE